MHKPYSITESPTKDNFSFYIMFHGTPSAPENIVLSRSVSFPKDDKRFYDVAFAAAKRMVETANNFS